MRELVNTWDTRLYNDKHAFVYDYGRSLIELLDPKPKERILDLGCGSGELTSEIAGLARGVVGIDKSAEMIRQAKMNFPLAEFKLGDAVDFQSAEKFDAIFSNATLHWVVAYKKAIRNMYANLGTGGRLVVEFGGKGNVEHIISALRDCLSQKGFNKQADTKLWYFPSIGEYSSALEAGGFKVTFAQWYDRPTELMDENTGLKDWLQMFAKPFFIGITLEESVEIIEEVESKLKPILFKNGKWFADYKRIRIIAYK